MTKVDFHKKDEIKKSKDKPKDDNEPKVISTPNFKNEKSNAKKSNKKKPVKYIAVAVSGAIVLLLAYGVTKNIKTTDASKNQITASEEANKTIMLTSLKIQLTIRQMKIKKKKLRLLLLMN